MRTSGPDLFIHSRPEHREGGRSGPTRAPTCNRSGGLTRKPLSIVLNWSTQVFNPTAWVSGLIEEIEWGSGSLPKALDLARQRFSCSELRGRQGAPPVQLPATQCAR